VLKGARWARATGWRHCGGHPSERTSCACRQTTRRRKAQPRRYALGEKRRPRSVILKSPRDDSRCRATPADGNAPNVSDEPARCWSSPIPIEPPPHGPGNGRPLSPVGRTRRGVDEGESDGQREFCVSRSRRARPEISRRSAHAPVKPLPRSAALRRPHRRRKITGEVEPQSGGGGPSGARAAGGRLGA